MVNVVGRFVDIEIYSVKVVSDSRPHASRGSLSAKPDSSRYCNQLPQISIVPIFLKGILLMPIPLNVSTKTFLSFTLEFFEYRTRIQDAFPAFL